MPVTIDFPAFTDPETLFEDMEAANNFFGSITVPNATPTSYGVVKRGAAIASELSVISAAFELTTYRVQVLRVDGGYDYQELCDKDQVQSALNQLRAAVVALVESLQDAGVIAS